LRVASRTATAIAPISRPSTAEKPTLRTRLPGTRVVTEFCAMVTDGTGPSVGAVAGGSSCLARLTSDAVAVVTIALLRAADESVAETTSRSVPSWTWADRLACTWAVVSGRSSLVITLSATRGPVSRAMYDPSRVALASGSPVPVVMNRTIDER
jgi:hypothetical protein